MGKFGAFISCTGYPECRYTRPGAKDSNSATAPITSENELAPALSKEIINENCPECQKPLRTKKGKFGAFISCTGYPECRYSRPGAKDSNSATTPITSENELAPAELKDRKCPKCSSALILRKTKNKGDPFIGCSNYPTCKYLENINPKAAISTPNTLSENESPESSLKDRKCPQCSSELILRKTKNSGKSFIGCSNYPTCKYLENIKQKDGITCPQCKSHKLVMRKSPKIDKNFYGCEGYPNCKYMVPYMPVNQPCPNCQWPILIIKNLKSGNQLACPTKCGFSQWMNEAGNEAEMEST